MQIDFIHSTDADKLLLIFSGWSTKPSDYEDISFKGWDTAVVHDYTDLATLPTLPDCYKTVYVIAWSLGVAAASLWIEKLQPALALAITGTLSPRDNNLGIPEAIYDGTRDNLTPLSLKKFQRRAGMPISEGADIEKLKRELTCFASVNQAGSEDLFDAVYLAENDAIFPRANAQRAWEGHQSCYLLEGQKHGIDLHALLERLFPAPNIVGKIFDRASLSYEEAAVAQSKIGDRLADMLEAENRRHFNAALEIGSGQGLFTKRYAEVADIRSAHFVDVCQLPEYKLFEEEKYSCMDAEKFMEEAVDESYDLILTSATMQWFTDPCRFLRNVSRTLKPGGIFLASTFLPSNLAELNRIRPPFLIYRSAEKLTKMLKETFDEVTTSEERIELTFPTAKELFLHLRLTGVSPSTSDRSRRAGLSLSTLPRNGEGRYVLTYHPLYILARKSRQN